MPLNAEPWIKGVKLVWIWETQAGHTLKSGEGGGGE